MSKAKRARIMSKGSIALHPRWAAYGTPSPMGHVQTAATQPMRSTS